MLPLPVSILKRVQSGQSKRVQKRPMREKYKRATKASKSKKVKKKTVSVVLVCVFSLNRKIHSIVEASESQIHINWWTGTKSFINVLECYGSSETKVIVYNTSSLRIIVCVHKIFGTWASLFLGTFVPAFRHQSCPRCHFFS